MGPIARRRTSLLLFLSNSDNTIATRSRFFTMIPTQLPAIGPIAPPPALWATGVAALQCFAIAGSFGNEKSNPTPYSKFAAAGTKHNTNPIPSRDGMFRIYLPSTIVAAIGTLTTYQQSDSFSLVAPLLFVHFFKRSLEVAFLHSYSGTMPAASGNVIGLYYALITLLVASTAVPMHTIASVPLLQFGLISFTVGELGNLHHHYLLSKLRRSSDSKSKRYVPPKGGLFACVAAPHYFFELVAWLGMACVAQQLNSFLVFASMASYLGGRAVKTNEFYRETFGGKAWPRSRKALIPGIY
jgi:3-oxo-5-alpha-steroid 4-dehydrogenase